APASRASRACSATKAMFSPMSLLTLVWINPARKVAVMSRPLARLRQQRIELARRFQGRQLVRAPDMLAVDEDLGNGRAPGARPHLAALLVVHHDIHLVVGDALAVEQALGPGAVAAERRRVDLDLGHADPLYADYTAGRTTRASVRTSTCRAPPRC